MGSNLLFEDIFEVRGLNPHGKKFDKVTRVVCNGLSYEMEMVVDIYSEVYTLREGEKFTCTLASTLSLEGNPDPQEFDQSGKPSLLDRYDYAMHGKVFNYEHQADQKILIHISFGGLLMSLRGDQRYLTNVKRDQRLYCLFRKTQQ